ncbi:DUF3576 domain-containing protein [Euryhalocaulis caribicus]|uniref:DUF3576 domain-containing protein n=1 Tax=Euryhalocaulis caribicus TaxID=1161401 RepID=UPI0003A3AD6E|nr:DUF3576 domain-containing protein [Euryhalocaulis caribicus]
MNKTARHILLAAAGAMLVSGCALNPFNGDDESEAAASNTRGGLFGGGNDEASIGVNAYLWRASLDTLDFMPLSEVDPFGGVIITEWYSNPDQPQERFKATVYILDRTLRADALKVSIFKQARQGGAWVDADVDPATPRQIENAILTRARQLRISRFE